MPRGRRLTPEERAIPAWQRAKDAGITTFSVRLDEGQYERLENCAAIDRRSLNSAVQRAIDLWCDRVEREQRGEG